MITKDVFKVIEARGSVRTFKNKDISQEDLLKIAEAGRQSPTARNNQYRKFTIIQNKALIQELAQAVGVALGNESYNFYEPNALILVSVPRNDNNGPVEVGLASQNMWLAATALDLGMVWTNQMRDVTDDKAVRKILDQFEIPRDHVCLNALALGFPAEQLVAKERTEEINFIS